MLKVVLDTNIIVSALLTDQGLPALIFDLALSQQIQLFYSPALMDEYGRVLHRSRFGFPKEKIQGSLLRLSQDD